ncbi:hypothetical protein GIRAFALES_39 [Mycobacterium phage Girafales]|nr:hypothetical protein GIRAFALES_39 [Mycobacterium phage Girafales]
MTKRLAFVAELVTVLPPRGHAFHMKRWEEANG